MREVAGMVNAIRDEDDRSLSAEAWHTTWAFEPLGGP
jgi:hypothetical protein